MKHIAIDEQPVIAPDGWAVHEADLSRKWFRPAFSGIYPFFDAPSPDLTHEYCEFHACWEWVIKK